MNDDTTKKAACQELTYSDTHASINQLLLCWMTIMRRWYQSHQLSFPASFITQVPITQRRKCCSSPCRVPTRSQSRNWDSGCGPHTCWVGQEAQWFVQWAEKEPEVLVSLSASRGRAEGAEESLHSSNPAAALEIVL